MINYKYPTVITFYTPTWEYEKYASMLQDDCKHLGVPFYSKKYEGTGEWITNTSIKPRFIFDTISELKRPVLWIDADGSLWKTPDVLHHDMVSFDFAACPHTNPSLNRQWHVGTLFFNYTPNTLLFLNAWVELAEQKGGTDEAALDMLWKSRGHEFNLQTWSLPSTYFEMFTALNQQPLPGTVISHRASKCPNKLEGKKRWMKQ